MAVVTGPMLATAAEGAFTGDMPREAGPTGRALVCDDDPVAREVVGTVLRDVGYAVAAEAGNAAECIQLTEMLRPDAIVLDYALVGMTGLEALPALRAAAPDAVIVLLSAFDGALAQAVAAGADVAVDKADVPRLGRSIAEVRATRAGGDAGALL